MAAAIPSQPSGHEVQFSQMFPYSSDSDIDVFSGKTFKNLHAESIEQQLPAYVIAVVLFSDKSSQLTYQKYDYSKFTLWHALCQNVAKSEQLLPYSKNRTIEKTIFMWQACFEQTNSSLSNSSLTPTTFKAGAFLPIPNCDSQDPKVPFECYFAEGCRNTLTDTRENQITLKDTQLLVMSILSDKHKALAGIWASLGLARDLKLGMPEEHMKLAKSASKIKTPPPTPERRSPSKTLKEIVAEATQTSMTPIRSVNRTLFDEQDDASSFVLPDSTATSMSSMNAVYKDSSSRVFQ